MVSTTSWPVKEKQRGSMKVFEGLGCPPQALETSKPLTFHILMGEVQFLKLGFFLSAPRSGSVAGRQEW